jgi:cell division protease FtsH
MQVRMPLASLTHDISQGALTWLPIFFFAVLVVLIWRTIRLMPRVKPNMIEPNSQASVTFADVAGVEEAKAELQEVVDFLRDPKKFARLGARVPKGLLLYGPPGTGKTLLAKAVAHESGASFYSQSASAFVEMFAGLGASRIRKLFATARKNAPSIIFIDELDAVGAARTGHGFNREQDQTLNQLLVELDGFDTAGLAGADLANICNEAAIFAGRRNLDRIGQAEFEAAMERVVAGLQQRRVVSEKEKRILAYHESGHALMSYLMGDALPVHKVTIVSRGQALGYTLNLPMEDRYLHTKEELVDMMKVFLAGRAAEQVVFGRVTTGAANDLEKATGLARSMIFEYGMGEVVSSRTMRADNYALSEETKRLRDAEQARLTDEAFQDAIRLITKHRSHLDRLSAQLLEQETLNKEELDHLLADIEPESRAAETIGTVRAVP